MQLDLNLSEELALKVALNMQIEKFENKDYAKKQMESLKKILAKLKIKHLEINK
ncbi:hypothetical protein CNEO4_620011 [Clostridium neonatale]|uniref:hypothetical protein n=1 Tax=Clostridium neonatale TaxID=137838 RepID=UPI00291B9818|nr:hypothetical protein [Clostridium neonatale]CAI3673348.1 hypothetical protein CNEO4_620011 [Clostridium neonatale]